MARRRPASRCNSSSTTRRARENSILHGDPAAEAFLSEWIGARADPGRAQHEHGVALRIRQPGRVLAALPRLHRAQHAGHGLCRRDGARAQPGGDRGDGRGRLGDGDARLSLDRLPVRRRRGRARAHRQGGRDPHADDRQPAARLVPGPAAAPTRAASSPRKAGSSTTPTAMPTTCRTGTPAPASRN